MKKTAFKSALIFTNSYDHFFRLDIPNPAKVLKKVIVKDGSYYILTGDGELWKINIPSQSNKELSDSLVVSNIAATSLGAFSRIIMTEMAANDSVMLAVSDKGHVYSWGRDTRNYGLLGLGNTCSADAPTRLLNLSKIQQVTLSYKHAAALDSNGEIYTWGTGNFGELCHPNTTHLNQPAVFRSHELLSGKNVVCHKNLTAVVTTGGHLLLYGSFIEDKLSLVESQERSDVIENNIPGKDGPRTILNMPNVFVTEVYFGPNFCVFLTKSLDIYIISDFYMCQKLDYASKFQTIAVKKNRIYGISDDGKFLVEWEYRRHSSAFLRQGDTLSFMSESCTEVVQVIHLFDEYQKGTHFQPFQETGEVTLLLDSDTNIRPYLKDKSSFSCQNLATVKFQRISGIGNKGKTRNFETGASKISDRNNAYSTRKVRSPSNGSFISQELSFERNGSGMSSLVFSQDKSRVPSLTEAKSPQHTRVSSYSKDKNSEKLILSQVDETKSSNDSFRTALEKKITLKIENLASAKKASGRSLLDGFEDGFSSQKDNNTYALKSGGETLKEKKSFYLLNSPTSLMSSGVKQRGTVNPNETLSGASKISFKNNEVTSWIQEGKGLDRSRDSSLIRPDSFLSPKNGVKVENKGLDRSRESSLMRPDSFLSPKNGVKVFASTTKAADKTTTNTKKSFVFESILPEQVRTRSREPSNEPPTVVSPVQDTYKVSTPQRVQQQPQQGAEKNPVQTAQKNQQNKNKFISSASPERVQAKSREVSNEPIKVASSMKNSYLVSVPQRVQQQSQQTAEKDRMQPKSINEQSHTRSISLTQQDNRRINVTNESNVLSTMNNFVEPEQNNNKFIPSATRISTKEDNRRPSDTNDSHVLSTVNNSVYSKQGNEREMRSSSQVNSPPYRGITADTSYTDLYTITSLKPAESTNSIAEDQEKSNQGNYFLPNGNNYPSKGAKTSFINNKPDYLSSQSMRTPKKLEYVESFLGDKTSHDTIYLDSEYDQKSQSQIVSKNNYSEVVKTSVFSPKISSSPVKAGFANQKERPESSNRFALDKAGNSNRSYLKQEQTKLFESNLIDVKKHNGGSSHQPSPKRGNSEKKYETLVAEKESTKKALYELLGKKMPEASIENITQPKETEKRSAFLIEGDYQEGISNNNTDDARSYMRYLGNGSLDLEKHEDEMNYQMSKPIDKDHEKVKSWISSIGPEETREGSLKDITKTTEGTFFSLVDDTMPKTPQNASSAQTPQNKPAAPQLELEKWGAFLSFMGNEANLSPGTRANSNKSTGKFMIREYIAKDETSFSSPIRRSIAENIELLKSDDYKNWEKQQKTLNMANMLLRKLDRTMYRCFVTLQIHSVKPSSEKTLAVLRLVNALKGAERSFKLKNKEAAFETIKKMKYQSLMKVIPKFAFKKLAGLMRIYTALDKENTLAKQGAFNKLKSIFEKHRDQAEKQERFISKSFALLSNKRENQLAETWNALKAFTKAKKEKEARTKSLETIFKSVGNGNRRIKLETAFQELKQKTKISYNLSGLFNVLSRYLLDDGMHALKSYSQNKKEKYLSLVADENNFVNISMEKLLMFIKRRTLYDIYAYSRDEVRKRPKSTQISFSVIMKSLYMRRLKNYYDSLRWHALEQANAKKSQLKDVVLKHLVSILQKKVTERCKEAIDTMKVHQAIVERMKAKEAKELEFKAMLLASKLNVLFKQRKTGAFYALKQSQNLQNQLKNKRYALVSLKNMIENLKKKTLKDAFNEILEVAEIEKERKKKEAEEQESKDKHDRKFHGKLDISEINMTKHDSQMSPSELENLLIRNSSGALLHRKSRFHFGNNDDSFGMDQISPFSPEKNEEDLKLDFEGMLAAVKAQRKLYRSWSDILNDKHYLKFNEPPLANVNARKTRSLVLTDQEQEHNETYRTASFMDKQKCLGILESLRQSLPASLAKIKNETFRKQTFSSSEDSQDNDQPVHKLEPENKQANSLDMIAIREILGKRALRNSQTIKLTRKRTEYVDQRIFLHKGPHHNRPDEVLEMFHQKVPNHYSNDTSAASVEQPSSKLNLSGFLQMKPSKSMILQSSDNLDRFERKNSIFQREAKSKAEIRTKDVGSKSELAGSVTEIEEFNPDMKSYEGKILTESLDMSSMRFTPTDLKRRNSLFRQTVDKEASKGFEKSDKNDRSFIDLDKDKSDLNQIEEGSSKSSLSGGNEQEQEQDLLQLKSTTSIDGFMQNPKKVTPKNVVTKAKSPRKALTINVIQPSGAKKQEVPKSTKSIASQKSVKVEKSTPIKVKKEDVTKEKTLKKSATLNKPSGGTVQSSTTAKGAGKSLFQTKSPIKK